MLAGIIGRAFITIDMTSAGAADTVNPVFKHATMTLTAATATPVPTSCTLNRTAVAFYNADSADVFYGDSTVSATGATKGLVVAPKQTVNIEVSCSTSKAPTVYVFSAAGCASCLSWAETR